MSVDDIFGGIISRIKQALPNITEKNLKFIAFILAGINYRIIAHIMEIKYDSVASKRMRLFKKIEEANIAGWNEIKFNKI